MQLANRLWQSSLGKKYLMALSGCALFLFVVGHMIGNLQVFVGPEAINRYAHFLQTTPEILWPARLGLLGLVVLHVVTAVRLWLENRAARPTAYAVYAPMEATYSSRTMIVSGLIVAVFIIYHLLHFTVQKPPALNLAGQDFLQLHDTQQRHDVYRMVILGFRQPLVSGFYILGMALLCLHLRHGVQAWFQSLGWRSEAWRRPIDRLAWASALLIFAGNCSIPVSILLGFGREVAK
jgi:succinate dehydrogenase / fumarate reductase, cytochrome b subunit